MELYPHQVEVKRELYRNHREGHIRQVIAMPTGAGKTVVAASIILDAVSKGRKVMFVVHMKTLVVQAVSQFSRAGLRVGIMQGANTDYAEMDDVIVASVQTLRIRKTPTWVGLVLIDECHILYKTHIDLMERWSNVPMYGLSATPMRPDLGLYYSKMVRGPTYKWLTDNGYLVPIGQAYCPNYDAMKMLLNKARIGVAGHGVDYSEKELGQLMGQKRLVGNIVTHWQELASDRPTICFAATKAHSRMIVEAFDEAGVGAAHIEDKTPDYERQKIMASFKAGAIKVLSSVGVLAIGFDQPHVSCLILARPTISPALDMQQKGRGIRSHPGKEDCMILDHCGNSVVHGLPVDFELPDLRAEEKSTEKRERPEPKMSTCTNCGFVLDKGQMTCPQCGTDRPGPKVNVVELDTQLVSYEFKDATKDQVVDLPPRDRIKTEYLGLLWYARERGMADGYAYHKIITKYKGQFVPPWRWKSLDPIPPSAELRRWIKSQNIRWIKSKKLAEATQKE